MATENPVPDDGPALDPFEAELVAYLDGELDPVAARKVELRLAKDPAARARAAELKKSYDLLDYLPRPEPSPTFTTRTLDKLPAVKATPRPANATPNPAVSTSMPVALEPLTDEPPAPAPPRARPRLALWAGAAVAVAAFAAAGYFATAAARSALFPTEKEPDEPKIEVEARVIENLPLYAVADDLAFVTALATPDLFGEDPAVAFDPGLKIPPGDTGDKPTGKQLETLTKAFRALPAARRDEIVKLDRDLHALDAPARLRLFRALEVYAVWLERLPDAERRGVLAVATPGLRLDTIGKVRDQQWVAALPREVRNKPELIQQWRDDEAHRRERTAFVLRHAEAFAANKAPWPFDTEAGRKEVVEFAKHTFKTDDPKKCRLSQEELAEYRRLHSTAERENTWAWYGLYVYQLSARHPYLPESDNAKLMMTELNDLPEPYARVFKKKDGTWRIKQSTVGKWPDFPLEVVKDVSFLKFLPPNPPLGPARLSDFKPAVREFATKELFPKLSGDEKGALQRLEGKWPDYPQRFVQYARQHDLSVPGVTLPGPPKKWDATYGTRAAPK
jgi:hypothetical protein